MINLFIRTCAVYAAVILLMRFTGKRQIGQLELTELVTAFMIGEFATDPVTDGDEPLIFALLPIALLVSLEIFFSYALMKSPSLRRFFLGSALVLVNKGKPDMKVMKSARITFDELMSAVRLAGVGSLADVKYAILEQNGSISVLVKPANSPPDAATLGIGVPDAGLGHMLMADGRADAEAMRLWGFDESALAAILRENGITDEKDVAYLEADDVGRVVVFKKEEDR